MSFGRDTGLAASRFWGMTLGYWLMQEATDLDDIARRLRSVEDVAPTVEALCVGNSDSEPLFQVVQHAIQSSPRTSWCFIEFLDRYPWYSAIRAFISLPDSPLTSCSVYPFYIMARNRLFDSMGVSDQVYPFYYHGVWRTLEVAQAEYWLELSPSVTAVLKLFQNHLERPCPNPFIVYFATALIGGMGSLPSSIQRLQHLILKKCDEPAKIAAILTLAMSPLGISRKFHAPVPSAGSRAMAGTLALSPNSVNDQLTYFTII